MGPGREFDRLRRMIEALGAAAGPVGGDTAAVPAGEGTLVVSTDASVEEIHFRREWLTAREIGWRAAAAALSDLAAAAATPVGVVAAIAVPDIDDAGLLAELNAGIGEAALAAGCQVLGGDLVRSGTLAVTVTVLGYCRNRIDRAGARPGDGVWVTGVLGGSRAALEGWLAGVEPPPAARLAFARPQPRLRAGRWLASVGATAMMDLSDGLGGDAGHIAAASGVGIAIDLDLLPIHPSVHEAARRRGVSPGLLAAEGGEDYELLVTMPPDWDAGPECEPATGVPLTRIGTVVAGSGARFRLRGDEVAVSGFDHGSADQVDRPPRRP